MPKFIKKMLKMDNLDKNYQKELTRAHLIIAFLSIGIIILLSIGASQPVTFDPILSAICVVLLSVVIILSLCMTYGLSAKKTK